MTGRCRLKRVETSVERAWFHRSKPKYDELPSNFDRVQGESLVPLHTRESVSLSLSLITILTSASTPRCGLAAPESGALRVHDARQVRYAAAEGRVELGCHRDGTLLTVNIALNASNEYQLRSVVPRHNAADAALLSHFRERTAAAPKP